MMDERCQSCRGLLDEEDLFCANCGTEAPHTLEEGSRAQHELSTFNFECKNCGAQMSYSAQVRSLHCPYCDSSDMQQQRQAKVLKARFAVPLAVPRESAEGAMRLALGKGFWRPSNLSSSAKLDKMTAVYVPYWVFRANSHTHWTADTSRTPIGARGDWFPLTGEHRDQHAGLLVPASGVLTLEETASISPFHIGQGVAPEALDRSQAVLEQFAVSRKYARPIARRGIESLVADACRQRYVPGQCRNLHVNTLISEMSSMPCLLPVWVMAYSYGDRTFRYLVNGQTGVAAGSAPVSMQKIFVAIALAVLVVAGILALLAAN